MGRVVPQVVEPTGRQGARRYTIGQWIKAVHAATGQLDGLTYSKLMRALRAVDEDLASEWSHRSKYTAEDFTDLLASMSAAGTGGPAWFKQQVCWVYSDDHRWDRGAAAQHLPRMLGLNPGAVEAPGPEESLAEYAERWNAEAVRVGQPLRLHDLAHRCDDVVLAALEPKAMRQLATSEHLAPESL